MVQLEKVTRALCLAVACLCVPWSLSLFGQQVTPDTYTPLPTLFQLLQKDPTFGGANSII
jgi:hypothetical protein